MPDALPRGLSLDSGLAKLLGEARATLGRLDEGGRNLPTQKLLLGPLQKQEAVLSNRIEGTHASLEDTYLQESSGDAATVEGEVREVLNYDLALRVGLAALRQGRALNNVLTRELHRVLLSGVRGEDKSVGAYRTEQVWLGGPGSGLDIADARFVPPPPEHVGACMDQLEEFLLSIHAMDDPLVRIALTHYQFECIHPFFDGNGRLGRLLISLQLIHERVMEQPWLYLSSFFEANRDRYYEQLYAVSTRGSFEQWIEFFLQGVQSAARGTIGKVIAIRQLEHEFKTQLVKCRSPKPTQLIDCLLASPYITVPIAQRALQPCTAKTARSAIEQLLHRGIVSRLSWRPKGKAGRPAVLYRCDQILAILLS